MWRKSDEVGCGGKEKERKTEVEVDVRCKCGLREKGLWGGNAKQGLCGGNLSATSTPHRSGKRCSGRRRKLNINFVSLQCRICIMVTNSFEQIQLQILLFNVSVMLYVMLCHSANRMPLPSDASRPH